MNSFRDLAHVGIIIVLRRMCMLNVMMFTIWPGLYSISCVGSYVVLVISIWRRLYWACYRISSIGTRFGSLWAGGSSTSTIYICWINIGGTYWNSSYLMYTRYALEYSWEYVVMGYDVDTPMVAVGDSGSRLVYLCVRGTAVVPLRA